MDLRFVILADLLEVLNNVSEVPPASIFRVRQQVPPKR